MSTLPAGPALDRLIAEKVMGWRVRSASLPELFIDGAGYPRTTLEGLMAPGFFPSSNIACAWEVVEHITQPAAIPKGEKFPPNTRFMFWWRSSELWAETSSDAAYRICIAALETMESNPSVA